MFDYGQNPKSLIFDLAPASDGFDLFSDTCDAVPDVSDQRPEILAWLSPLEPGTRHRALQADRVPGVGDWLLQTQAFQSWSDVSRRDESDNAAMFCYGNPGVGKTYIA